jgi:hypothetical protein
MGTLSCPCLIVFTFFRPFCVGSAGACDATHQSESSDLATTEAELRSTTEGTPGGESAPPRDHSLVLSRATRRLFDHILLCCWGGGATALNDYTPEHRILDGRRHGIWRCGRIQFGIEDPHTKYR